jgi:hypothetical protein
VCSFRWRRSSPSRRGGRGLWRSNRCRRQWWRGGLRRRTRWHYRRWRRRSLGTSRPFVHKVICAGRNQRDNHNSDSSFTQAHNPFVTRIPIFALPSLFPSYNMISRESGRGQSRVWCIKLERTDGPAQSSGLRPSRDTVPPQFTPFGGFGSCAVVTLGATTRFGSVAPRPSLDQEDFSPCVTS